MNLVLDSSILIDLERQKKEVILKISELRKLYPGLPAISFATYVEFLYGLKNKSNKNKEKFREFLEQFYVMHTSNKTADILVSLMQEHELPMADLLIAAQTIENGSILVTKDKDFERIKEVDKIII